MFRTVAALILVNLIFLSLLVATPGAADPIDFERLLNEMSDLELPAKLPDPAYATIQFSSYDRKSVSPEAPDWFSNADGFGREPIPGFQAVLEEPGEDGVGLYLVTDIEGPGAMVRGWSAAMAGKMRVFLDGSETPIFEGSGYDFLARRTPIWLGQAGMALDTGDAFNQQDADYLPIPFEKSLYVTWRGTIEELHFYHLEVRLYEQGARVISFDPARDIKASEAALRLAVERLTNPACGHEGTMHEATADLEPNASWTWETPERNESEGGESVSDSAGAITEFSLKLAADDLDAALRGGLLRIAFDGAHKPQVEAPAGDFFGTGAGLNPFDSLPMTVAPDGTMTCRFIMPFQERAQISLLNSTDAPMQVKATIRVSPWTWDHTSLYFRAKWRSIVNVDQQSGPFDVPYIVARGRGVFVGAACMLVNPSPFPHPYGSWWGEGDEKIFVDGEPFPSFYGTGSEDYYNYSWSRPDLFDHPYCGQPANTGPGNQGYCSNHRWHVIDAVPFREHFAFYMELWPHSARPGLCYACIAYLYARPGAIDDHRRIQMNELKVMPVPSMEPEAGFGSHGAIFFHFEKQKIGVLGGAVGLDDSQPCASRKRLITWTAAAGDKIELPFDWEKESTSNLNIVAAHWPDGGAIKVLLDGTPLTTESLGGAELGSAGEELVRLKSRHARRLLSTRFKPAALQPGKHVLTVECIEGGAFGFDYLWVQ